MTVFEDLRPIWDAFLELSASRPHGFGPSSIPISEIAAWFALYGPDDRPTRRMWHSLIRALDAVWLRWQRETKGA